MCAPLAQGEVLMDTQRWQLAGDIFERLLGAPQAERASLLLDLCGPDAELKQIVVSMLDSQEGAHPFSPAPELNDQDATVAIEATERFDTESVDSRIGPWRLVRKIGVGGMGVVWLAERADGQFHQRSALKLIKRGMDSDAVLARFLRERQILARLEHKNIAHLLDGGIAADGRPYFAMEFVEGLPLLEYCREKNLKLEDRIKLFLGICAALRFAHAQHVVHRDIKPSNVLVTPDGGVKLLDFGIAKLLQNDEDIAATLTDAQRGRPMTPAYAAPEQISGESISEATDVYALGGVLYELLTGRRPHDFTGATAAMDVLRIIQSTDPVAPSRLKLARSPVPRKRLRGDLDTIVLTALKHEPSRRYASVAALAADLENYLVGKPVAARRDHVFYRGYKFLRRHRSGAFAIVVIALVILLGAILVWRERAARGFIGTNASVAIVELANLSKKGEESWIGPVLEEQLASELAVSGKVHTLPGEIVRDAQSGLQAPNRGGYARASLAILRKRLDVDFVVSGSYFVSGSSNDAKVRLDLAVQDARNGLLRAAVTESGELADVPRLIELAGTALREKLGLQDVTSTQLQEVAKARPATLDLTRRMGNALDALHKSDPARAKSELDEVTALSAGYAPAYVYLAQALKALGYDAKALAAAQQAQAHSENLPLDQQLAIEREVHVQKFDWSKAIDLDRKLVTAYPHDIEKRLDLIADLVQANLLPEADSALADLRKQPGTEGDPRVELQAAGIADARGDRLAQLQHAQRALDQALARDQQFTVALAKQALASAKDALGQIDEAATLIRETIGDYQKSGNPRGEADARVLLAIILGEQNQPKLEREEYQRALEIYQWIGSRRGIALIYRNLLRVLWVHGDRDGAEKAGNNALEILRDIGDSKGQAWVLATLATLQMDESANDASMESLRQAIALNEQSDDRVQLIDSLNRYAFGLHERGSLEEAQKVCARTQLEAKRFGDPYSAMVTENECAALALDRGDVDGAKSGFMRARELAGHLKNDVFAASIDVSLAKIDMALQRWQSAIGVFKAASTTFALAESVADEANTQSLLARCYQAMNIDEDRDRAMARAKELRSRITARAEVIGVDILLSALNGETGDRVKAIATLRELADDAEKRQWIREEMEAKLAIVQLLERTHDVSASQARAQLEVAARQHGFNWVLARLRNSMDG